MFLTLQSLATSYMLDEILVVLIGPIWLLLSEAQMSKKAHPKSSFSQKYILQVNVTGGVHRLLLHYANIL